MEGKNPTFPFTIAGVQAECAHCSHQLVGTGDFGLDILRCPNCRKFSQVESRVVVTKVDARRTIKEV